MGASLLYPSNAVTRVIISEFEVFFGGKSHCSQVYNVVLWEQSLNRSKEHSSFFFFWPCLNLWDWPLASCISSLSQTQDFQDRLGNILPEDLALIYLNEMKIENSFFLIMSYYIKSILYPFKWRLKSLQRRAKPDSLGLFLRARDQIHVLASLET